MDSLIKHIEDICTSNPGTPIWIAGDVNIPDINWSTDQVITHQYPKVINESFLQMLARTGMEQIIDFPTRKDNILDVIITNRPSLLNRCEGMPGLSDHDVIYADWNIKAGRQKSARHKIFWWKHADFESIRSSTKQWANNFTTPVESLASEIEQFLKKTLNESVPSKFTSTRHNQPWFNTTTKRICRRKVRSYKKAKRTNKDRDWKRYRRLKKQAQTTCRQAYTKYINDIICSEPGASRRLGAFIKANRCDQTGVAPPERRKPVTQ